MLFYFIYYKILLFLIVYTYIIFEMFNFFDEVKNNVKELNKLENFNIINLSNKVIYAEGHKGLVTLSKELVSFKVKGGRIVIEGNNLFLIELTENTIKISGNIKKVESFWCLEKQFSKLKDLT